jgi:lipoprotein-anchoring transpeptidase ErfK/SrfK
MRTIALLVVAAAVACAAAPGAERARAIAPGVTVSGVRVGGLLSERARTRIDSRFSQTITIDAGGDLIHVSPAEFGSRTNVDAAVTAALSATPGSRIALPVRYSRSKVDSFVKYLARRYNRAPVSATVVGATSAGPEFTDAKSGVAVDSDTMQAALVEALETGRRAELKLLMHPVAPRQTANAFGPVIVVTRGANTLRLYDGRSLIRTFPVATGQTIYPTPPGVFQIVDKQENPWWYPPTQDAWARGLKPVPPGPSNPLGTRWMGLSAPGVGIHGTDADTSIGYSVSHGCIRMHVPDAEWLFERVSVGTPVVIL